MQRSYVPVQVWVLSEISDGASVCKSLLLMEIRLTFKVGPLDGRFWVAARGSAWAECSGAGQKCSCELRARGPVEAERPPQRVWLCHLRKLSSDQQQCEQCSDRKCQEAAHIDCEVALLTVPLKLHPISLVAKVNCIRKIPHVNGSYRDNVYVTLRKPHDGEASIMLSDSATLITAQGPREGEESKEREWPLVEASGSPLDSHSLQCLSSLPPNVLREGKALENSWQTVMFLELDI